MFCYGSEYKLQLDLLQDGHPACLDGELANLAPLAKRHFEQIEALLDWERPEPASREPGAPPVCPRCQQPMRRVGQLPRAPP